MKQTITDRVKSAADVLDFVQPDWATLVNLDTLEMAALSTDVANQIGRGYQLDYMDDDAHRVLISMALIPADDEDYPALTAAWRDVVTARQQALVGSASVL